jgi:hypothetical protein
VSLNNNTTDVTSVAETSNPSRAHELIPVINGVRVFQFLDFCVVLWLFSNTITVEYRTRSHFGQDSYYHDFTTFVVYQ